jgi:hypothetical protein
MFTDKRTFNVAHAYVGGMTNNEDPNSGGLANQYTKAPIVFAFHEFCPLDVSLHGFHLPKLIELGEEVQKAKVSSSLPNVSLSGVDGSSSVVGSGSGTGGINVNNEINVEPEADMGAIITPHVNGGIGVQFEKRRAHE